jgi:negative regulator of flagellin synthesis FlgM
MKIDSSSLSIAFSGTSGGNLPVRNGADEKSTPAAPASSSSSSTVSLSNASTKIQELESGAQAASGFDAARVAAIKQAIREGKFQVSPQMIAEKLLISARSLIQQQVS